MRNRASANPTKLSESLSRRLNVYAATAGAACPGMLTAAQPASAQVVYTPAHVVLDEFGQSYDLDVDHDGTIDFRFRLFSNGGLGSGLSVTAPPQSIGIGGQLLFDGVEIQPGFLGRARYVEPLALNLNAPIGDKQVFTASPIYGNMACYNTFSTACNFADKKNRYLGLRFYDLKGGDALRLGPLVGSRQSL